MHQYFQEVNMGFVRLLLVALVSFILFMIADVIIWGLWYEPTAPQELHARTQQMQAFDTKVAGAWVLFVVAVWMVSRFWNTSASTGEDQT